MVIGVSEALRSFVDEWNWAGHVVNLEFQDLIGRGGDRGRPISSWRLERICINVVKVGRQGHSTTQGMLSM